MGGNLEDLSFKIYEVMKDIGVTSELVKLRRYSCLVSETVSSLTMNAGFYDMISVGSQIEGSTTLDMKSDFDKITCTNVRNACLNYTDLSKSMFNFLMIRNETSSPPFCSLQFISRKKIYEYRPIPLHDWHLTEYEKRELNDTLQIGIDNKGRILTKNIISRVLNSMHIINDDILEYHGPALRSHGMFDFVWAINCPSLPTECRVLFTRPKPGHWPKQETLVMAQKSGVFCVFPGQIGHLFQFDTGNRVAKMDVKYATGYASVQWRLSTNIMERLLMFDLDSIQMKTYVLCKLLKKEFLSLLVGDRLSTFHLKTAFLFTVEQSPEHIWRKNNIVQCVKYCLNTLRRFLKRRFCPHYTIANVNLFDDKVSIIDIRVLIRNLTDMIITNIACVKEIKIDNVGARLSGSGSSVGRLINSRAETRLILIPILLRTARDALQGNVNDHVLKGESQYVKTDLETSASNVINCIKNENKHSVELEYLYQNIVNTLASIEASECIACGNSITEDILNKYSISVRSGQISNYLKYASMLICSQQLELAEDVITQIEEMITPDMFEWFEWLSRWELTDELSKDSTDPAQIFNKYRRKIIYYVEFTRHELKCVPRHLVYDMFKTIKIEDTAEIIAVDVSTNRIIANAVPFLYYLKYLCSSNNSWKKEAIMEKFTHYLQNLSNHRDSNDAGHIETTFNMLGHIFECENRLTGAWSFYAASVKLVPHNNAAYWHLFRLIGKCVYENISCK